MGAGRARQGPACTIRTPALRAHPRAACQRPAVLPAPPVPPARPRPPPHGRSPWLLSEEDEGCRQPAPLLRSRECLGWAASPVSRQISVAGTSISPGVTALSRVPSVCLSVCLLRGMLAAAALPGNSRIARSAPPLPEPHGWPRAPSMSLPRSLRGYHAVSPYSHHAQLFIIPFSLHVPLLLLLSSPHGHLTEMPLSAHSLLIVTRYLLQPPLAYSTLPLLIHDPHGPFIANPRCSSALTTLTCLSPHLCSSTQGQVPIQGMRGAGLGCRQ